MSHFNDILHYVVHVFKDFRDHHHNLTGPIRLERFTDDGYQYLYVSCKINILFKENCEKLSTQLNDWYISDGNLNHVIDVERARYYNGCKSRLDPHYAIA